jgi:Putative transposase of IS4/5 family (DUF4096)
MTDTRQATVHPPLPVPGWPQGHGGQPEAYCHRSTVDAIRYPVDNATKRRALPADFPPGDRGYAFFRRWRDHGLATEFHDRPPAGPAGRGRDRLPAGQGGRLVGADSYGPGVTLIPTLARRGGFPGCLISAAVCSLRDGPRLGVQSVVVDRVVFAGPGCECLGRSRFRRSTVDRWMRCQPRWRV